MEACSYLGVHIVLKRCEVIAFYGFKCYSGVECCIVLYNDKSCSRGMYTGIEGRGERGIWTCVFEFILRCKDTWSPIIDGTRLLIMNLSNCYRLSL